MEVFRVHRNTYGVITKNYKQKQALFRLIGKRDPVATYYEPNVRGKKEQFTITAKECDLINEKLRT